MSETLRDVILDHLSRDPDRPVFRCAGPAGETVFLARTLLEAGSGWARAAVSHGARAGDRVALLLDAAETAPALVGAWLAGLVPVVLPLPRGPADLDDLAGAVRNAGAAVLLAREQTALLLPAGARCCWPEPGATGAPVPAAAVSPAAEALHVGAGQDGFSLSHADALRLADEQARALDLRPDDRLACSWPLSSPIGLLAGVLLPLVTGLPALLHVPRFTGCEEYLQAVHATRATVAWLPGPAVGDSPPLRCSLLPGVRLGHVRAWVSPAGSAGRSEVRALHSQLGQLGVRPESLRTGYGLAEAGFFVAHSTEREGPRRERVDPERLERFGEAVPFAYPAGPGCELVSAGGVVPGVEVRIMAGGERLLLPRRVGVIQARRVGCAWQRLPHLGYLADGHLFVLPAERAATARPVSCPTRGVPARAAVPA